MFRRLTTTLVVTILALSYVVDATTDESLQMKIFNRNFRVPASVMQAMLKKANLTGRGYIKEVTTMLVEKAGGGKPDYHKASFFYKVVQCSQVKEVEEELNKLFPGVIGKGVESKFKKEIKYRHMDNKGQCKVGLEVHFKEEESCYPNQKAVTKGRKKRGPCSCCRGCIVVLEDNLGGV